MLKSLWSMVNSAETLKDVAEAETQIRSANISNEDFEDLMSALSYISRELNHR